MYEKIIRMMLEDWDVERGVRRGSQYADFTADRKLAFLASMAYTLSPSMQEKVFREASFIRAYEAIHERFGLPRGDAKRVVAEVQSHSGIIVASGQGTYEFAHLSIQEYLVASYIVRAPDSDYPIRAIPAPLAVAVALSSDPARWFSHLVLSERNSLHLNDESVTRFLSRLFQERPAFGRSDSLGCAFLLLYKHARGAASLLTRFAEWKTVRASIAASLLHFTIEPKSSTDGLVALKRRSYIEFVDRGIGVPVSAAIPESLVRELIGERIVVMKDPKGRDLSAGLDTASKEHDPT
jgi:hypothetical protein